MGAKRLVPMPVPGEASSSNVRPLRGERALWTGPPADRRRKAGRGADVEHPAADRQSAASMRSATSGDTQAFQTSGWVSRKWNAASSPVA